MQISHTRDLEHNYLVLTPDTAKEDSYALKMLTTQRPSGMLPMEVRLTDGNVHLYCVTDSAVSLSMRCLAKKLTRTELQELVAALAEAEETLAAYLVDPALLYLTADTVFYNTATREWRFVCDPFAKGEGMLASFAEELTLYVEETDEEAQQEVFSLCERTGQPQVRARDLVMAGEAQIPETQRTPEPHVAVTEKEEETGDFYREMHRHAPSRTRKRNTSKRAHQTGKHGKKKRERIVTDAPAVRPGIVTLLFAVVFFAGLYIRKEYLLTPLGSVLSVAVIALSLVGMAGTVLLQRGGSEPPQKQTKKTHKKKRKSYEGMTDFIPEDDFEPDEAPVIPQEADNFVTEEDDEEGCTTLLTTETPKGRTAKLYGRGEGVHCHIALDKLPLTLGKLAGCADYILRDESVSRLHAHIMRDAGEIRVRDLNSTNGTYLNGVRLKPDETVTIHVGDEVCFGDMVFDYV